MATEPPDPKADPNAIRSWIDEQRALEAVPSLPPRRAVDWLACKGDPPARRWVIRGWLGRGYTTLLAGPAGAGKTALAQAIGSAVCLGRDVIDQVPEPTNVLLWAGEDDANEIWRRQAAIGRWLGEPIEAFAGKLYVDPSPDRDITLAAKIDGQLVQTALVKELREQVGDYKAGLVFLDSIAKVFGGNENDRHEVTQFLSWLTWALEPTQAALCLLGHPAKAKDSEYSGSTAWEASVRARLYFGYRLPDQEQEETEELDDNTRWLAKRKTNYSERDTREVRWCDGCMQPAQPPEGQRDSRRLSPEFLCDEAVRVFRKLSEMGLQMSGEWGPTYLPAVAHKRKVISANLSKRDIESGLTEALKSGRLKVVEVGKGRNGRPRRVLAE